MSTSSSTKHFSIFFFMGTRVETFCTFRISKETINMSVFQFLWYNFRVKYRKEKCLTYAFMLYIIHILLMSFTLKLKVQSLFFLSLDLWNYCLLLICKEFRRCIYIIKVFHYSQTVASTENVVLFVTELSTTRKLFQFRYMEWNWELPNKMEFTTHILL